jgi:predicted ferric reductase
MSLDLLVWEAIRAGGLLAYTLLSLGVILGLATRTRAFDALLRRGWVNELQQSLSVASLAAVAGHVAFILLNTHEPFSLSAVFVPFASAWQPLAVTLGVVSMYLAALLVASSWLRPHIGHKAWRAIHYAGFGAWGLALVHGLLAGSDAQATWVLWLYASSAVAVGSLLAYRVLGGAPRPAQAAGVS